MFISEDGTVTGSINVEKLKVVKAKTPEAKAQLKVLLGEVEPLEAPEVETIDETSVDEDESDEEDLDALRSEAEAAGVKVDRRWGAQRLQEETAAANASAKKGKS